MCKIEGSIARCEPQEMMVQEAYASRWCILMSIKFVPGTNINLVDGLRNVVDDDPVRVKAPHVPLPVKHVQSLERCSSNIQNKKEKLSFYFRFKTHMKT